VTDRIHWRLGAAIASGVPLLVLVSVGPVAAAAGPPAALVWPVSALVGAAMACSFAHLARLSGAPQGGIAVLAGEVLAARSPGLARMAQWSYWVGWSPALAIDATLVGSYVRQAFWPAAGAWLACLLAAALLCATCLLACRGIRPGALVQAAMGGGVLLAVVLLVTWPPLAGLWDPARLRPFAPPGGWLSWTGFGGLGGALFLAGWSAYGCEIVLTYSGEIRGRRPAWGRCLLVVAAVSFAVYAVVPLSLSLALPPAQLTGDPALALGRLAPLGPAAAPAARALVVLSLVVSMNMIAVASSRVLVEMSRRGDAWTALGRLNRHGAPHNALLLDLVANLVFICLALAVTGGSTSDLPVALLAAANVGYLVSIVLALVAAWVARAERDPSGGRFPGPAWLLRLSPALIVFNVGLLGLAGAAWGWGNVGLGVLFLVLALTILPKAGSVAQRTPAG
jgi:amino acid transporter